MMVEMRLHEDGTQQAHTWPMPWAKPTRKEATFSMTKSVATRAYLGWWGGGVG